MNKFTKLFLVGALVAGIAALVFMPRKSQATYFGGIAGSSGLAQINTYVVGTNTLTNVIASTSTNFTGVLTSGTNNTGVIDLENAHSLGITIGGYGVYSNVTVTVTVGRSPDSYHWDTNAFMTLSGTVYTGVYGQVSTNFDVGTYRYWAVYAWTNGGSVSNLYPVYCMKPGY